MIRPTESNEDQDVTINDLPINNNNLCTSYSTRRRHVRNLKKYIFSLGTFNVQASFLSDFLNDNEMKEVVRVAGMKSPKES